MEHAVPGTSCPPSLLLVEDDANDQYFLKRALTRVAPRIVLSVIPDGRSAIDFLSQFVISATAPFNRRPFLTLSDIHLPRASGWDLLRWMRRHVQLGDIPVLLWTSLPNPEGALRAHEMGAAQYFSKPRDASGYSEIASCISRYLGD